MWWGEGDGVEVGVVVQAESYGVVVGLWWGGDEFAEATGASKAHALHDEAVVVVSNWRYEFEADVAVVPG